MSKAMNDSQSAAPTGSEAAVGYRNPPKANRFVAGRSGNPNGRPKKRKRVEALAHFFGNDDFDRLLLEEAERTVTMQDKGRSVEMPAIQAMLRTAMMGAIRGDRAARDFVGQSVREAKRDQAKKKEDYFESYRKHYDKYYPLFLEADQKGLPEPEIYPNPNDLYFNHYTKEVMLAGPMSAFEAKVSQHQRGHAAVQRARVEEAAKRYERARLPAKKKELLESWHKEQARFDQINDSLPLRYQIKLEHRSYEPGASEPKQDIALIEFLLKR